GRRIIRVGDAHDVPADVACPVRCLVADTLVHVFIVKHHARRIGALVSRLINSSNDKLPSAWIYITLHRHDITEFEVVSLRDINTDNGGVALTLKDFELIFFDKKFRIDIEKRCCIASQSCKELLVVDVDTGKPGGVGNFLYPWHLSDTVAVRQWQRKNKGDGMPGNQSICCGRLYPRAPRRTHGSQQGKRHHGNAYPENR